MERRVIWICGLLLLSPSACGDDIAQTDDESTGSSSSTGTVTTGEPEACSRVHPGDLYLSEDTDLALITNIGQVNGNVYVSMGDRDQRDLAFLGCLHTIEGVLSIMGNSLLETTEGVVELVNVKAILVEENPNLRIVDGFPRIRDLYGFSFRDNPVATEIHLDSIETMHWINIGLCVGDDGWANNLDLVDLAGFSGLVSLDNIQIDGNEALIALDVLDVLLGNGAPEPLRAATIRYNPLLSDSSIQQQLDALGVESRVLCENAGSMGAPECMCPTGE